VYASAVHGRWINKDGEEPVKALAVASEPEIFWREEDAGAAAAASEAGGEAGAVIGCVVQRACAVGEASGG
jgi:hypothetical protein